MKLVTELSLVHHNIRKPFLCSKYIFRPRYTFIAMHATASNARNVYLVKYMFIAMTLNNARGEKVEGGRKL